MNETVDEIDRLLREAFQPSQLSINDESWKHAGHAGAKGGGGHFVVEIASDQLSACNRIAAHRQVNEALKSLFPAKIHALSINIVR